MSKIWAIARLMIAEGLRMKIALVFLVLIAAVVVGLPFSSSSDSTLTGAVKSFMSYGLSATGLLLSMLTIFMSRSLSDELVSQKIFLTMTKPIARWQYVLGKWVGMMVLNLVFLITSAGTIYGMVYYIKVTKPPSDERYDAKELANEVLVARHATAATLPDFTEDAELEFQHNVEQGRYASVPEDFDLEHEKKTLRGKHEMKWRVVGPENGRVLEFERLLCDRSPGKYVQLRYKTEVTGYPPDEIFRAYWEFGDPYKNVPVYTTKTRHIVARYHTIRIPANAVADDNTLQVRFFNQNRFEGERQANNVMEFRRSDPLEILFTVGSFEWNLVRLLSLMMFKLMFLGAVALLCTTVFSFPVACLASFTVYVIAGMRSFITESMELASNDFTGMFDSVTGFLLQSFMHAYNLLQWIIPNFGRYDAVEHFVAGRSVGLAWVLQGFGDLVLIKTVIVLGLAMLLFHRREVAEVSF